MASKRCPKCSEVKAHSEFSRSRQKPDGLYGWCKVCVKMFREVKPRSQRASARPKAMIRGGQEIVAIGESNFGGQFVRLCGHLLPKQDIRDAIKKMNECMRYLK